MSDGFITLRPVFFIFPLFIAAFKNEDNEEHAWEQSGASANGSQRVCSVGGGGDGSCGGRPVTSDIYVDALKAAFKIKQMRNKSPSGLKPGSGQPRGAEPWGGAALAAVIFQLAESVCRVKPMLEVQLLSFWCLGEPGAGAADGQEMRLGGEGNESSSSFMADFLSCVRAICAALLLGGAVPGSGSELGKQSCWGRRALWGGRRAQAHEVGG